MQTYRRVADLLGKILDWRKGAFGCALPHNEHVNLSEFRSSRLALRALMKRRVKRKRVVSLSDSNVVVASAIRGRSKSRLLRICQKILTSELLFHEIYTGWWPISSKSNPADHPSRGRPVPPPLSDWLGWPEWLTSFLAGEHSSEIEQILGIEKLRDARNAFFFQVGQQPDSSARQSPDEWEHSAAAFANSRSNI